MQRYAWTVPQGQSGRRITKVLQDVTGDVPYSAIMRALRKKQVLLDGKRVAPSVRVQAGQEIRMPWEPPLERPRGRGGSEAELFSRFDVVFLLPSHLCVINKPPGLLVQPSKKGEDSVVNRFRSILGAAEASGLYPAPVHRLDRNTSGIVVVALSRAAQHVLHGLLSGRGVEKRYLALVAGVPPAAGEIDRPLRKDRRANQVYVDTEGGQRAVTRYGRIRASGSLSLVEAILETGRSHQIRCHMASLGFPIVGDRKYGGTMEGLPSPRRPLLHACSMTFPELPGPLSELSGKTLTAPIPLDMQQYAARHLAKDTFVGYNVATD
ncbi:MAG: RluA family pseudouridine synthase [Synergistales bacterium]|nr:RluA family pseudouridine synthase [Synergistales bacterium]